MIIYKKKLIAIRVLGSLIVTFFILAPFIFSGVIGGHISAAENIAYSFKYTALGFMLTIGGIQIITIGIISEILMRTYYESQRKKPYRLKRTISSED